MKELGEKFYCCMRVLPSIRIDKKLKSDQGKELFIL